MSTYRARITIGTGDDARELRDIVRSAEIAMADLRSNLGEEGFGTVAETVLKRVLARIDLAKAAVTIEAKLPRKNGKTSPAATVATPAVTTSPSAKKK